MPNIPPINSNSAIVDDKGRPKLAFVTLINNLLNNSVASALSIAQAAQAAVAALTDVVAGKADKSITISTDAPLSGGGDLSADRTISLDDTAVTPGSYGDSTHVAQISVDQKGRITAAAVVAISGGGGGGGALVKIDQQRLAYPANSVSFSSIPSTYTDLIIVGSGQDSAPTDEKVLLQFNGDTGSNYDWREFNYTGTATGTSASALRVASLEGNAFVFEAVIGDYAGGLLKRVMSQSDVSFSGSPIPELWGGVWQSTAQISSIQLASAAGSNFAAGSVFTLYGRG